MTVEIDSSLMRAQTTLPSVQTLGSKPISSSINSQIITQAQSTPSVTSPTTNLLSAPAANDSIINRRADPAQGLYQTCATLRKRLRDVPDFEQKFLLDDDGDEDPVNQLWRVFQKGSSLCVLFNALRPVSMIEDEKLQPDLGTKNACKAACFHFLKGIKEELGLEGEDTFMISHLWSEDTNGFVKVTKTVSRILDELQKRKFLIQRTDGEGDQDTITKPMDNRGRVVQELVDTERKYVQDLEALQDYMKTLQASEVAPPDLIHNMFLNLNSLVDFQRRFLIRVETVYAQPPEQQRWGQVMVSHENSFDVYEPYCANFNSAQALAVQEAGRLAKVAHPVAQAGVTGFLIKPVQRICKYPLLFRDMSKYSDSEQAEELKEGLAAIERVNTKVNEAIRKVDMSKVTEDLAVRVEDWKGHRLDQFGSLLLNGQFTVIKGDGRGDLEREYHIYLFQKILLCCKEIGPSKKQSKTMSMGKKAAAVNTKKKTNLQLKGRIFMQNVTDIVWVAKNGNYTLQIFWKGDPGVEDFVIKHRNEETLNQWKNLLQHQVDLCHQMEGGIRSSGGTGKTSNTEFMWMQNSGSDPTDYGARSEEELTEDEDDDDGGELVYTPSYGTSRNGSNSSLRSRSATVESGPPPHIPSGVPANPQAARQPRYTHQSQSSTSSQQPLLSLVTYPSTVSPGAQSPDRAGNMSYFSPTSESSVRGSTVSGAYPFPRQPTPNYPDEARYPPGTHMSRTTSREGSGLTATQAVAGQRLQRPSLPGMSPGGTMQNRLRSASSPNIHHVPTQAQLARATGIPAVPVPPMPPTYQAYTGGPAVINRSQNNSPTSPMIGLPQRHASPGVHEQASISRLNGNSAKGMQPQVKVRVSYSNEIFIIIVPYNITYPQLMDRIERKIRICGTNGQTTIPPLTSGIRIRYQDEDGDFITMNSDDDVQMAFDVFCDPGLTEGTIGIVTLHVQI
ncbi:hypothetical protein L211DRAFT_786992 [Terfezia boudieri ATCC MYA-4762]|uniref:DH domain-containing protein n=1 Tax=Terfezia boudieri ATCC MYA-4762 TaxID=1051890 RepID=A0A3N4LKI8_9PEZI|nr:hypothetical protein L211DRAFT_786992 [Terfezia boudieri ATCC MYA-4762]